MPSLLASSARGKRARFLPLGVLLGTLGSMVVAAPSVAPRMSAIANYTGSADASGAVAVGTTHFAVVDDEDDFLRIYRREGGGAPVAGVCLSDWRELQLPGGKKKELDLEGGARVGDTIFWLGSHGNSKEGKITPGRRQLFATIIRETNGTFQITLDGQPYRRLMEDLLEAPQLREFNLGEAAASGRAPKDKGGLNIEGMCATVEGHLLLGFRNPIPHGRALLVPILNPLDTIRGKPARLGNAVQLDLQGRGIRDLVLVGKEYFLIAGDYRSKGVPSQLYRWAGGTESPRWLMDLPHLNPEVLIAYPDTGGTQLQVLSDDGQKPSLPPGQRKFRSVVIQF